MRFDYCLWTNMHWLMLVFTHLFRTKLYTKGCIWVTINVAFQAVETCLNLWVLWAGPSVHPDVAVAFLHPISTYQKKKKCCAVIYVLALRVQMCWLQQGVRSFLMFPRNTSLFHLSFDLFITAFGNFKRKEKRYTSVNLNGTCVQ